MKRIFLLVISLLLVTGCNDMMNTPTKRVEEYLGKYQILDSSVLENLDKAVDESNYSSKYKKEYKDLMIKQYQNLSYKIKNEHTDGDIASVIVEVEVFDYHNALDNAKEYIDKNKDEFLTTEKESSKEKMDHYNIKMMQDVTSKASYSITFNLVKDKKKWVLDGISNDDLEKIHGLYKE